MEKDLKTLYKERYSGKMKFSTSFPGVNSTIFNALKKELPCKNVLDIGCGSGRLALYCSRVADTVLGIDFSKEAINLAIAIREALEGDFSNAAFRIDRFENIQQKAFDVVVVADVFEHIQGNPKETLRKLSSFLSKDGLLVVSCPGFVNFRGTVWMTLQTLFDFLMSPSDLHFINPWLMRAWCEELGLVVVRQIGCAYDLAWSKGAYEDMKRRIHLAFKDQVKNNTAWASIPAWFEKMDGYLKEQTAYYGTLIEESMDSVFSKCQSAYYLLPLRLSSDFLNTDFGTQVDQYLKDSGMLYIDTAPQNEFGGVILYLIRKKN